jgi:hypothetical protein
MIGLGLGFGLGLTPNSGVFEGLDPDAKGYIDAVVAAGGTVSGGQKSAINTFYKTGKSDGWYSSLKRNYLPIWGVAAANAIDMIGLTSGTFVGGVTHGAGFVQGNGTSGYFATGFIPSSNFANTQNASIGWLAINAATTGIRSHLGCQVSTDQSLTSLCVTGSTLRYDCGTNSISSIVLPVADQIGIIISTSFDGRVRQEQRRNSGFSTLSNSLFVATGTLPNIQMYGAARNLNNAPALHSDARYGAWFANTGMSAANADAFTLALKDLWETATGLTLP